MSIKKEPHPTEHTGEPHGTFSSNAQHSSDFEDDKKDEKNSQSGDFTHAPSVNIKEPSVKVDLTTAGKPRHRMRLAILFVIGLLLIGGGAFGYYTFNFTQSNIVESEDPTSLFGTIHRIIDEDVEPLKGEKNDRINIALFGQGGLDHPGGTLADTIMLVSIQPSTDQVAMMSIPRDMNVAFYNEEDTEETYPYYYKINSSIFRGGVDTAVEILSDVTGQEIQYYAVIDFTGFRDLIDSMGGIDLFIDNPFSDYEYPDYNYGYQTITFTQGEAHFDGEKALQYARSRHGNNGEGSDFARAKRQQKIIEAVRDKALSLSTILNPTKINGMLNDIGEHASTNMQIWEMVRFAEMARNFDKESIINKVIDNSPGGLVHADTSNGYNLVPNAGLGDYSEISAVADSIFALNDIQQEKAVVALQNASALNGVASSTANTFEAAGIPVERFSNALVKTVKETVVYDLTPDTDKEKTVAAIHTILGLSPVSATIPANSETAVRFSTDIDPNIVDLDTIPEGLDLLIILGADTYQILNAAEAAKAAADSADTVTPTNSTQ